MGKFETGYASMAEAVKDGFAKIGGPKTAFQALETGWYNLCHRKERNMKASLLNDLAKANPELQKQVDAKLAEELGRAPKAKKTA